MRELLSATLCASALSASFAVSCLAMHQDPPAAASGAAPASAPADGDKPPLKPEELEQLVAPIALYPDSLLSQIFMASTYPMEVVMADRWVKANGSLKGDALAKALADQTWDASVKSLVNFPQVLAMMSDKLDWTVKLGDAFLDGEKPVMDAVQTLRGKANSEGNLKSNEQQKVIIEPGPTQVIQIESSSPDVIYVPTYNPTVVYGSWPYPAYPPATYYPPGYVATAAISFGVGVACGMAWGYAWGGCNWHGGDVNINTNRNTNINNTRIDRNNVSNRQGAWQHDSSHRGGVAYRDNATAGKFGGTTPSQASAARQQYRGRTDSGAGAGANRAGTSDRSGPGVGSGTNRGGAGTGSAANRAGAGSGSGANRAGDGNRAGAGTTRQGGSAGSSRPSSGNSSAFRGSSGSSGRSASAASSRGSQSRSSGGSRGGGGGSRGGGGARGGGGRR